MECKGAAWRRSLQTSSWPFAFPLSSRYINSPGYLSSLAGLNRHTTPSLPTGSPTPPDATGPPFMRKRKAVAGKSTLRDTKPILRCKQHRPVRTAPNLPYRPRSSINPPIPGFPPPTPIQTVGIKIGGTLTFRVSPADCISIASRAESFNQKMTEMNIGTGPFLPCSTITRRSSLR